MLLYHYTSVALAESILSSALKHGHLNTAEGIIKDVVWFTSDPSPEGHGLLNGKEKLSEKDIKYLSKVEGVPIRNKVTADKTKIRLTVDIPDNENYLVQPYVDFCKTRKGGENYAKAMGLSCYFDLSSMNKHRLRELMKKHQTKEGTWWISFAPISSSYIRAVDYNNDGIFAPYSFDLHGRKDMEAIGLFAPSNEALDALRPLIPQLHPLEQTKALVICTNPTDTPYVAIRGNGQERMYDIRKGEQAASGAQIHDVPEVKAWLSLYRSELLVCWEKAIESFYKFYPDRRPT